jgi:hypothetical protein
MLVKKQLHLACAKANIAQCGWKYLVYSTNFWPQIHTVYHI